MSLRLPDSACTPIGCWPKIDSNAPNPLKDFEKPGRFQAAEVLEKMEDCLKIDRFFYNNHPIYWLPEVYAADHGGDTEGFVEGLEIMSNWRRFPLRASARSLLMHCRSEYGKKQLALLASFFVFQVGSDHLAINAGSSSMDHLKNRLCSSQMDIGKSSGGSSSRQNGESNESINHIQKTAYTVYPPTPVFHDTTSSVSLPIISSPSFSDASDANKVKLKEPWNTLATSALALFHGQKIELPPKESRFGESDPVRQKLYSLALEQLELSRNEMMAKPKFDQSRCPNLRRSLVALSGIWDLFTAEEDLKDSKHHLPKNDFKRKRDPKETIHFSGQDLKEAKRMCWLPQLQETDEDTTCLLDDLIALSKRSMKGKGNLDTVLNNIYMQIGTTPQQRPFLLVLMVIGDQAIRAASRSRSRTDKVYETGAGVRKGDCVTKAAGKVELNNFEAKKEGASAIDVLNQRSKSFKLTRSIMVELQERFQLGCPPGLTIHGLTADVVAVREWGSIYVAGRACQKLIIPATEEEWVPFLTYQASILKKLLELYDEMATEVMDKMAAEKYLEQTDDDIASDYSSDADNWFESDILDEQEVAREDYEYLEISSLVFHTPTKAKAKCMPNENSFGDKFGQN
ncbi:hypothetical protein FBU30_010817 [Linnemannia zychae]|nr:hypothetical protein FBU30_010817 [Linnemannia zychae]